MKTYPDAMIDTETLGLGCNPAILSIGVQMFNRDTGALGPTFYQEIDFDSAVKAGDVKGSTVAWWVSQGDAAKRLFSQDAADLQRKLPLATALHALITFFREHAAVQCRVWANGPSADIVWLESAFERGCVGLAPPWSYKNVRDVRTALDLPGYVAPKDSGVKHNALADATWQAKAVCAAWGTLVPSVSSKPVAALDDDL